MLNIPRRFSFSKKLTKGYLGNKKAGIFINGLSK
jgi:hypothetical protein